MTFKAAPRQNEAPFITQDRYSLFLQTLQTLQNEIKEPLEKLKSLNIPEVLKLLTQDAPNDLGQLQERVKSLGANSLCAHLAAKKVGLVTHKIFLGAWCKEFCDFMNRSLQDDSSDFGSFGFFLGTTPNRKRTPAPTFEKQFADFTTLIKGITLPSLNIDEKKELLNEVKGLGRAALIYLDPTYQPLLGTDALVEMLPHLNNGSLGTKLLLLKLGAGTKQIAITQLQNSLTDIGLQTLLIGLPELEELDLTGFKLITNAAFSIGHPTLKVIKLEGTAVDFGKCTGKFPCLFQANNDSLQNIFHFKNYYQENVQQTDVDQLAKALAGVDEIAPFKNSHITPYLSYFVNSCTMANWSVLHRISLLAKKSCLTTDYEKSSTLTHLTTYILEASKKVNDWDQEPSVAIEIHKWLFNMLSSSESGITKECRDKIWTSFFHTVTKCTDPRRADAILLNLRSVSTDSFNDILDSNDLYTVLDKMFYPNTDSSLMPKICYFIGLFLELSFKELNSYTQIQQAFNLLLKRSSELSRSSTRGAAPDMLHFMTLNLLTQTTTITPCDPNRERTIPFATAALFPLNLPSDQKESLFEKVLSLADEVRFSRSLSLQKIITGTLTFNDLPKDLKGTILGEHLVVYQGIFCDKNISQNMKERFVHELLKGSFGGWTPELALGLGAILDIKELPKNIYNMIVSSLHYKIVNYHSLLPFENRVSIDVYKIITSLLKKHSNS